MALFPERISEEEMPIRRKEWKLAGYTVPMNFGKNKVYIVDGRRHLCHYVFGLLMWKRRDPDLFRMSKYGRSAEELRKDLGIEVK